MRFLSFANIMHLGVYALSAAERASDRFMIAICALSESPLRKRRRFRVSGFAWQALIAAAVLPIAVACVCELLSWGVRSVPQGDHSILELQVLRATRGQQLLGPCSRFGWAHPGPLYFYLLAPLYFITKLQRWSLYIGTGAINLLCAFGFLRACFRRTKAASVRLVALFIIVIYLTFLLFRRGTPLDFPSGLTDYWNPLAMLLPLIWLIALCAEFATGETKTVPYIVVLSAMVVQSHVTTASFCVVAILTATLSCLIVALRKRRLFALVYDRRWRLLLSGVLAIVVWFPPLLQQLSDTDGNLAKLWRYAHSLRIRHSLDETIKFVAYHVTQPILHPTTLIVHTHTPCTRLDLIVALAFALLLGVALVCALRFRRPFGLGLTALAIEGVVTAFVGALTTEGDQLGHLGIWYSTILVVGIVGAAAAIFRERGFGSGISRLGGYSSSVPLSSLKALLVLASLVSAFFVIKLYHEHGSSKVMKPEASWPVAQALRWQIDSEHSGIHIHIVDNDAWGLATSAAVVLEKQGVPVSGDPYWQCVFGKTFSRGQREVWFAIEPIEGLTELIAEGRFHIYMRPE